jgi:hypothetical protein
MIATLDKKGLRKLAKGKIILTIEKPRDFVVIESELIDYLAQLKGVTDQIAAGNYETFTVSGDYFSNNLRFTYEPSSKNLEIYEMNGGTFKIAFSYREFKSTLLTFYKQALCDLQAWYPELSSNEEFRSML